MSMIRKIIPVSLYDIPGLEGWLEEQASQGLFPTSLGSWAVFEDRGLPEVLQKLREHRGVALRRAPRPFLLLNKSN
mgnify:CR=1 FL=1